MAAAATDTFIKGHLVPSSSTPVTLQMSNRLSLRLYTNCLPNYLEVAPLHKGLVLMLDGKELIEEGMGFGVPVVKYRNKTFFSSSAKCYIQGNGKHCTLIKSFALDMISRKRVGKASFVNDEFYRPFHKLFEKAYVGHKSLSPVFNRMMELGKIMMIETEFIKVKPQGTITFRYSCQSDIIQIQVNLSELELEGCQEILILNEQGASFFRKYLDTDGWSLLNEKIGAWEKVKAKEASLSDVERTLEFTLKNKDQGFLFRGREKTKDRFSWAGLSYSLEPRLSLFDYTIKVRVTDQKQHSLI